MQLYFLHIRTHQAVIVDNDGSLYPDFAAARRTATAGARDLISADVHLGAVDLDQSIEIFDHTGSMIGKVEFASVVKFVSKDGPEVRDFTQSVCEASDRFSNRDLTSIVGGISATIAPGAST
jgi:hypothetical protein